jgi:soluble lytic murein transglycosylase-like protein
MKAYEFLSEEQLDELDFKKAIAGGALSLAAASTTNPEFKMDDKTGPEPVSQNVQNIQQSENPKFREVADKISKRYKVNPKLALDVVKLAKKYEKTVFPKQNDILAIIGIESSFNPSAVSALKNDPAVGLTQIRPSVWGLDATQLGGNIEQQIAVSSNILSQYNKRLKNPTDAVHAYNVGLTAFLRGDHNPNYVQKFEKEKKQYN